MNVSHGEISRWMMENIHRARRIVDKTKINGAYLGILAFDHFKNMGVEIHTCVEIGSVIAFENNKKKKAK